MLFRNVATLKEFAEHFLFEKGETLCALSALCS